MNHHAHCVNWSQHFCGFTAFRRRWASSVFMSSRPPKRARLNAGSAYRDQLPIQDDFDAIHTREGRLRRVGNGVLTAPVSRDVQLTSDSWKEKSSWVPTDDPEYGLDPIGDWYDEVVEMPVMADGLVGPSEKPRKKKTRSLVAVSPLFKPYCFHLRAPMFAALAACCLARPSSLRISR